MPITDKASTSDRLDCFLSFLVSIQKLFDSYLLLSTHLYAICVKNHRRTIKISRIFNIKILIFLENLDIM